MHVLVRADHGRRNNGHWHCTSLSVRAARRASRPVEQPWAIGSVCPDTALVAPAVRPAEIDLFLDEKAGVIRPPGAFLGPAFLSTPALHAGPAAHIVAHPVRRLARPGQRRGALLIAGAAELVALLPPCLDRPHGSRVPIFSRLRVATVRNVKVVPVRRTVITGRVIRGGTPLDRRPRLGWPRSVSAGRPTWRQRQQVKPPSIALCPRSAHPLRSGRQHV